MEQRTLSDRVRGFILAHIPSVLQLEIVLQLHAAGPRFVTLNELASSTGIDASTLREQLGELTRQGLVATQATPEPVFAYSSTNPEQDLTVSELAQAYQDYRVSVINLIYSRPTEKIRTFADAFRFFPGKKDPGT